MKRFNNIDQVWAAIDQGKTVNWVNDSYAVTVEDSKVEWRREQGFELPTSNRNGKCLRVTCLSNWFGSLLLDKEISSLYVKGDQ